jgi:hypothetical protein
MCLADMTDEGAEQGLEKRRWGETGRETLFVNAALLDDQYRQCYVATVVDL